MQITSGTASTVLTASGQVNGRLRPLTPTESKPVKRLRQNLAQLITSARGSLNQIWCKSIHWGLLGKWVKCTVLCLFYLFIYAFFS